MNPEHYNENFTLNPVCGPGRYAICPLNETGFEKYLSPNSRNYHFLNKIDPRIIKEFVEEMEQEEKEKAEKLQQQRVATAPTNPVQNNEDSIYNMNQPPQDQKYNVDVRKLENENNNQNFNLPPYQKESEQYNQPPQNQINPVPKNVPKKNQIKQRSPFSNNQIKFNQNQNRHFNPQMLNMNRKNNNKNKNIANNYRPNGANTAMPGSRHNMPVISSIYDYRTGNITRPFLK